MLFLAYKCICLLVVSITEIVSITESTSDTGFCNGCFCRVACYACAVWQSHWTECYFVVTFVWPQVTF